MALVAIAGDRFTHAYQGKTYLLQVFGDAGDLITVTAVFEPMGEM
jgi:hypothetical protein